MRIAALSDIADSIDYGVTASATDLPVGPKFLRITDIQDDSVDWDTVPFCDTTKRAAENAALKYGDIVFARTGATTGKSFLIRICPDRAVFASYLIRVRPGKQVDPIYLSHYFQSPSYWAQIQAKAAGAAQPGVNASKLAELQIPLPPLQEQQRIAAIMDQADTVRRKRREALSLFANLGQAIFCEMFGSEPSGYPMVELADLIDPTDKLNYGVVQPGAETETGVPLLRAGDILQPGLNLQNLKKISPSVERAYSRSRLKGTEILIACVGSIGASALANETLKGVNIVRALARVPLNPDLADRFFIFEQLRSVRVQRYFQTETRTVSQPTLNIRQIKETKIFLPDMNEQLLFRQRMAGLTAQIELQAAAAQASSTLFSSLQHRAFRGEL